MSGSAVARNYAATLFELAEREESVEHYGELIAQVAALYEEESAFRRFLETPRIALAEKKKVLRRTFEDQVPELFIRFLMVVLERRRQRVLPGIAEAYQDSLDEQAGRLRTAVTLPFEPDDALKTHIVGALEEHFGKQVVPDFRLDPAILGGLIVRVGDQLMDASLRRQLERLKWELI
jgi:F-type H+-transporting ATPase subunit delta